jgi:hypothetical protein
MTNPVEDYHRVKVVKDTYQDMLMAKANVVGVGIGFAQRSLQVTNELALIVMVNRKLPPDRLEPQDVIPTELDGVAVDVQQTGDFSAQD